LKPLKLKTLPKGLHSDGGNLFLQVTLTPDKSKRQSWIFRYATGGKEHWLGLGSLVDVSLAKARAKAAEQRKLRLDGIRPH
jgi:Arm DNA-binding domain